MWQQMWHIKGTKYESDYCQCAHSRSKRGLINEIITPRWKECNSRRGELCTCLCFDKRMSLFGVVIDCSTLLFRSWRKLPSRLQMQRFTCS